MGEQATARSCARQNIELGPGFAMSAAAAAMCPATEAELSKALRTLGSIRSIKRGKMVKPVNIPRTRSETDGVHCPELVRYLRSLDSERLGDGKWSLNQKGWRECAEIVKAASYLNPNATSVALGILEVGNPDGVARIRSLLRG
jgi:hypothetical protein